MSVYLLTAGQIIDCHFSSDASEIIAPIPRRDLLHTHESKRWLYSPSHSPVSSRAISPVSQNPGSPGHPNRPLSFSTLMDYEKPQRSPLSPTFLRNETKSRVKQPVVEEHGAGKRWIRWMHKHGLKNWVVPGVVVASIWVRWCIGLGSYSGKFVLTQHGSICA